MERQLPNNDPDLTLARQVGTLLERGESLSVMSDPLADKLDDWARSRRKVWDSDEPDSQQLWSVIEREAGLSKENTEKELARVTALFSPKVLRWAAAAVVLLTAMAGWFYLQFPSEANLIAETGDQVETVELADGSRVTLRPHTRLYELTRTPEQMGYRLSGEAYFDVADDPARTFSVEAGRGHIRVLGTRFTASNWGKVTQVYLEEGRLSFEGPSETDPVIMEPGQVSVLYEHRDRPEMVDADPQEFTDWMNNELVFRNKPVNRVFREVEQQFNITITAPDGIGNTRLSGELLLGERETTLDDLALVLGGTFTKTGERTYTFIPD